MTSGQRSDSSLIVSGVETDLGARGIQRDGLLGQCDLEQERAGAENSGVQSQLPHVLSCVTLGMPLTLSEPHLKMRVILPDS